ncbi:unnamed protein product [Didymodactylos carnosus]|uniref:Coiled-coil domain-containing protein 39 n=2 Tax=Didymodactylos carnosus TaxID=1234261 RepID=A0A8S2ECS5_9BILA|nr:unnamed protein product [Didymodactylos carnosus]CAF3984572.1 unnamed protein product [Didymodactylos carnosus]
MPATIHFLNAIICGFKIDIDRGPARHKSLNGAILCTENDQHYRQLLNLLTTNIITSFECPNCNSEMANLSSSNNGIPLFETTPDKIRATPVLKKPVLINNTCSSCSFTVVENNILKIHSQIFNSIPQLIICIIQLLEEKTIQEQIEINGIYFKSMALLLKGKYKDTLTVVDVSSNLSYQLYEQNPYENGMACELDDILNYFDKISDIIGLYCQVPSVTLEQTVYKIHYLTLLLGLTEVLALIFQDEINIHQSTLRQQLLDKQTKTSEVSSELHDRIAKIEKLRKRYQIVNISMAPPESATEEETSQKYYVIKAAQEKEELQRQGDELDAKIRKAEKELRAEENTLKILKILNTGNSMTKDSFKKLTDSSDESTQLEELEIYLKK